jgi:hypothetical protein
LCLRIKIGNESAHFDKFIQFYEWKTFYKFPPIDVAWIPQICIVPYEGFCIHMYLNVEWGEELNGIHAMKKLTICIISYSFVLFPFLSNSHNQKNQLFFDDFTIYTQ